MNLGVAMLLISLVYLLLTSIMYYSKQRLINKENIVYSSLIITSFIGITLELMCIFFVSRLGEYPIMTEIVNRGFLLYIFIWCSLFTIYVYVISFNKNKSKLANVLNKNILVVRTIFAIYCLICITLLIILPLNYFLDGIITYSYGSATNFLYIVNVLFVVTWLLCLLPNIKKFGYKKYVPLFTFILGAVLNLIVRELNPGVLLITVTQTFITVMMYFTIENPDLKMVEKLNYAKAQSELSNDAKNKFLKNMSHELMTPLNKAIGINSFNMDSKDEEVQENAKMVDSILEDITEISRNIIDTINLQTGSLDITNRVYNPKEIIDRVIKLSGDKALEKGLKLELDIKDDLPIALYGDDVKIKQVLMNLVDNAIKYTNKGYVKMIVLYVLNGKECDLTIKIKDTGIGISHSNVKKLFKSFSRIDVEKNITIQGMGLGLSISKQLLDLMGGKIDVESEENKGSTFTIKLKQELIKYKDGD